MGGGGVARRECRKEGERDSSKEGRETFLLKVCQVDWVWGRCGPVASLVLGLEEQVVALVGEG